MTVLVIDIGSSSIRALLFDHHANPIPGAIARRVHTISAHGTFDVQALQHRVAQCIDDILEHKAAAQLAAVGLSSFASSLVGVDRHNQALTPLLTYADTRSIDEFHDLRSVYEATDTHQRTGCPHHTAYYPSQLSWLRRHDAQVFAQVNQWLDIGSFLYRQWFGRSVPMSYSCASWSGMLHRNLLQWDPIWLDALHISPDVFPDLADFDAVQRGLTVPFRERWPVLKDVPFYLAVGDGAAANVGSGAVDENTVAVTVGTTAAIRTITNTDNPSIPAGLWGYRVDAKRHLIGGATTEGGNLYQWVVQNFILPEDVEAQIAQRAWGEHGLTVIPTFAGERSPGFDPAARGEILGLGLSTTGVDVLQAVLESITARLKSIFTMLPKPENLTVYAGGGALEQSSIWVQMLANHFEQPIHFIQRTDTTARGIACLLLSAMQKIALPDCTDAQGIAYLPA